ncbi:hypothetical protein M8J77_013096 [Diaphorina citri]|nr:hypothetical protein M8J77_013096 [Diaphorina citri]
MKLCEFCGKIMEVSNLSRHHKLCSMKPPSDETVSTFTCNECGKSFSRKDNLRRHSNSCQSVSLKKTKLSCNFSGCSVLFSTRIDLIDHMVGMHQSSAIQSCQFKEFNSHCEFVKWKETEEQLTYSYFSQKGRSSGNTTYFYCQKDGSAKAHRKNDEVDRLTNRKNGKGQVKLGKYCISSMKVVVCPHTNLTKVWYFPTHNHSLDVSDILHQPMSSETSQYIQEQIVLNASPMDIVRNVQNRAQQVEADTGAVSKDVNVTSKVIREQMRKKNMASLLHSDDAKSVQLLADKLLRDDPDMVVIYKPLGEACVVAPDGASVLNEEDDLFMFGFQTQEQRQLMIEGCSNILVVDETHCTNQYDYQLLNVLIVDNNRNGWPVAHLITSKSDEHSLKHFFSALKGKCPDLNVNCVITDDDPSLINAMNAGFSVNADTQMNLRHLLCKWHLLRSFRKNLNEKAPRNLVDEMFVALKIIVNTRNSNTFDDLVKAFLSKYGENASKFIDYFQRYLLDGRIQKWAMCHRNFPHQAVDTTGHVESFHRRLKNDYMLRKPNKRIDKLIELLLTIASDDLWKRKRNATFCTLPSIKSCAHEKSLEIPDSNITYLTDNVWEVKSSHPGQPHEIIKLTDDCNHDHCITKCTVPSCFNLCSHLYYCSCLDVNPLCKHIHKLHSFLTRGVPVAVNASVDNEEHLEPTFSNVTRNIDVQPDQPLLRDKCKMRIVENLKKLLENVDSNSSNWSSHLLCKVDTDIESIMKNITSSTASVPVCPTMIPTSTITPSQKLRTQDSQLLPFKRIKKRRKPVDVAVLTLQKKAVLEDLKSYIPVEREEASSSDEDIEMESTE